MGLAIDCDDLGVVDEAIDQADDAGGDELEQQVGVAVGVGQVASLVGGSAHDGRCCRRRASICRRRWGTGGPVLGKSAWASTRSTAPWCNAAGALLCRRATNHFWDSRSIPFRSHFPSGAKRDDCIGPETRYQGQ